MRRFMSFMSGVLLGSIAGAVVALLFTPASGDELRQQAEERYHEIENEVRSAAAARRAELERQLAELRKPQPAE
jgi:gas vesicle protein